MNAKIKRSGCIGCGLCIGTCPDVFGMADDGMAEVIAAPGPDTLQCAKEAAANCPVSVITVEE